MSGIDFDKIKYNDEKVYRMLWDKTVIYDQLEPEQIEAFEKHFDRDGLNNGLPEISTVFLGGMIKNLKPTTFEELVRIEGLSHGTNLYVGSQKEALEKRKITPEEVFGWKNNKNE